MKVGYLSLVLIALLSLIASQAKAAGGSSESVFTGGGADGNGSRFGVIFHYGRVATKYSLSDSSENLSLGTRVRNTFGAGVNLPFITNQYAAFSLQPEANYVERGIGASEPTSHGIETSIYFNANYLEIPAFARVTFLPNFFIRPYVMAGPSFNFLLSRNMEVAVNGKTALTLNEEKYNVDIWKPVNITTAFGAGVDIDVSHDISVGVSGRYSVGLTETISTFEELPVKSSASSFQVMAGVQLRI